MRGTTQMNMGACIGLRETLANNRPGATNHDHYSLNQYAGKSFFDNENYRAAIDRLDGGKKTSCFFFLIKIFHWHLILLFYGFQVIKLQWT